jgi:glutathione synthase/RimK-type ligase-like ATP-grasp enzyme
MIAIHHRKGSFSVEWIKFLDEQNIPYELVNAYDNDIIIQLKNKQVFLWHFNHDDYKDALFAKELFTALDVIGIKTFPSLNERWFFDDKLAQKYLFEVNNIKHAHYHVFYDSGNAIQWLEKTTFPKVMKLRKGSGSSNVFLVNNLSDGKKLIKQSFSSGFPVFNPAAYRKRRFTKFRDGKDSYKGLMKGIIKSVLKNKNALRPKELGYVLFQDFIPNNGYDIRVVITDNKAFTAKRMCRPNDFKASGSNQPIYENEKVSIDYIKAAFKISAQLKSQCIAIDFVKNSENNEVYAIELSGLYDATSMKPCKGYWNKELKWIEDYRDPQNWVIANIVKTI